MADRKWLERVVREALATVDAEPFEHEHQVVGTCRPCVEEACRRVARAVAVAVVEAVAGTVEATEPFGFMTAKEAAVVVRAAGLIYTGASASELGLTAEGEGRRT